MSSSHLYSMPLSVDIRNEDLCTFPHTHFPYGLDGFLNPLSSPLPRFLAGSKTLPSADLRLTTQTKSKLHKGPWGGSEGKLQKGSTAWSLPWLIAGIRLCGTPSVLEWVVPFIPTQHPHLSSWQGMSSFPSADLNTPTSLTKASPP